MPRSRSHQLIYIIILFAFLCLATLFAWRVPDWQAPDEPAHYNYIAQVASGELLPIIALGDWDNLYLEQLKANDFAPELLSNLDSVQYEDHQPPLYYWLATPIFSLADGNLFAVRMVSVVLAVGIVALSFTITLTIFPQYPHRALAVMALVAFLPQNMHILASVNNDALAGLMVAILTLLCVRLLLQRGTQLWVLGIIMGLTFIVKTTAYFMAGVCLLVILMHWWQQKEHKPITLLRDWLHFGIPAAFFAILYWGRNLLTYGIPDFLGLQAHDEVVIGQQRRVEFIADNGISAYWREAFYTTFNSFWGQFGWMEARLADALPVIFNLIIVVVMIALAGLVLYFWRYLFAEDETSQERVKPQIWILLGTMMLLALAQYVYYNSTFVQFQGRYLFVAIIPFAIGLICGIDTWRERVFRGNAVASWVVVAIFGSLAALDFYLIWRVIPCAVGC